MLSNPLKVFSSKSQVKLQDYLIDSAPGTAAHDTTANNVQGSVILGPASSHSLVCWCRTMCFSFRFIKAMCGLDNTAPA